MSDIRDEAPDAQIIVVDNGGKYERQYNEYIIKPNENLRWVKGVNLALRTMLANEQLMSRLDGFMCLNDDIRLSRGFFNGILEASYLNPSFGLIAPVYDDVHKHQRAAYRGPAEAYKPESIDRVVNYVDGTAFYIPANAMELVGLLDEEHFGRYGWGSDYDYSIRMMEAGFEVAVTHRAFINHFHQGSAKFVEADWSHKASLEMQAGMHAKYGEGWASLI